MSESRPVIRVLVVEDSAVLRELLVHLLEADPAIQVIGTAANGTEAIEAVRRNKPDVVTMDYHMPKMNGMEATRAIMEQQPVPIIIVSGSSARREVAGALSLLDAGALAVVEKPPAIGHPGHEAAARELVQAVKTMAEVKVIRRWPRRAVASPAPEPIALKAVAGEIKVVAMGASTGGPIVLKTILAGLPRNFPVPILIVQHIAGGFTAGLADWLAQASGMQVRIAHHDEIPLPGTAYVAPDGLHMAFSRERRIALSDDAPESGYRPSVARLFRSAATVFGSQAAGVLLTGMGVDGAAELRLMRERGAVTIAQDRESSVVHGMPGEAIRLQAAAYVLSPAEIAAALARLAK
jgi:two-component system chemotaxis response regulator CheB